MGYIYKMTNIVNNKVYIGFTQKTIQERWKMHINTAYNKNSKDYNALFKKAIRKYGEDKFIIEEIEQCDSLEELKKREIYWIKYYNSYAFDNNSWGYNSTKGGDYTANNKEIYQIDIISGKIVNSFSSILEAEEKTKAGDINSVLKRGYGEQPLNSGTTWIYKEQYNDYNPKDYYEKYNIICQLDLQGNLIQYWIGPNRASKTLNIAQGNISSCLNNNRQRAGNFQWCYYKNLAKNINKSYINRSTYNKKSVDQFDLCDNYIRTWESATEAARQLNIQSSKITAVCRGMRKTTGGFKLTYTNLD